MLRIKASELHLTQRNDVRRAKTIIVYFIRLALARHRLAVLSIAMLSIVVLLLQGGFLFFLSALVGRLVPANIGADPAPFLSDYMALLANDVLMGLVGGTLFAMAAGVYTITHVATAINISLFRELMEATTAKLVRLNKKGIPIELGGPKAVQNIYTKGCRYAATIVSKSLGVIAPVLATPFLLCICFLLSPELSLIAISIMALIVPVHVLIARRGIALMRGLLSTAVEHAVSKRELIEGLNAFPRKRGANLKELNEKYVRQGSAAYLSYYRQRRLLAAVSTLTSMLTMALIVTVAIMLLFWSGSNITIGIDRIVGFVLALRFLSLSIGQILSFATTAMSVTPLCEDLFLLLTTSLAPRALDVKPQQVSSPIG